MKASNGVMSFVNRQVKGTQSRVFAAVVLCASLSLGACGDMGRFQVAAPKPTQTASKPNKPATPTAATEREHERILSSYGGAYDDPKLEALITKTVERLVA